MRPNPLTTARQLFDSGDIIGAANLLQRTRNDAKALIPSLNTPRIEEVDECIEQMRGRLIGDQLEQFDQLLEHGAETARGEADQRSVGLTLPAAFVLRWPGQTLPEKWASACVTAFALCAVLSVIGGVVIGLELSKQTVPDDILHATKTTHDSDVLVPWIAAGVISAVVWIAFAVLLALVRDISIHTRRSDGEVR